MKLKIYRVE